MSLRFVNIAVFAGILVYAGYNAFLYIADHFDQWWAYLVSQVGLTTIQDTILMVAIWCVVMLFAWLFEAY